MAEKTKFTALGRRKRSVAKVTLVPGKGVITVNGKDVKDYMPYETLVMDLIQPLQLADATEKYDINIVVKGGGFSGQTGAIRLGIARALMLANAETRPTLKSNGMITRDARIKERKKYGLKKARRAPQFSKR
ncbi:MAG: 30S ribosomal protein S9 [Bacillales bacterium]|jgi:small subunit ribosomal protein S9|nr:30S ribosomal protein S9 [Bacillales bacterium]MCI7559150.1 30S ribosomal protein S9 [Clostridium sp.]CDA59797.1 30S ribosomal protein S9 [Clostridium sp. CAG:524]